jgi:hypothetical protein
MEAEDMERSRNVIGAISFLAITMFMVVYDMIMEHTNEAWTERYPEVVHHSMGFLEGVVIPAIFLLSGFALLYAIMRDRRGYIGVLLLGILGIVWNVPAAIWRFQAEAGFGASICLFQVAIGILTAAFAFGALQESRVGMGAPSGVGSEGAATNA